MTATTIVMLIVYGLFLGVGSIALIAYSLKKG